MIQTSHISIIIAVHNADNLIGATIESILGQDFGDFCLYIVDDGSTDRTREVVASYEADRRLRYLYQDNSGQAAALNRGLRAGREPYVSFCDADDLWRSDRLARVLPSLQADPSLGLVCNDFAKGTDPSQPWASAWNTPELGYRPVSGDAFERLLDQNFIPRSGVLIPRSVLDEVGGLSEAIGGTCGCDDFDMWLRIARIRPILCLHETLTFKRVLPGQYSSRICLRESSVRLWEHWERLLRGQDGRMHKMAEKQLAGELIGLSYKIIEDNRDRRLARQAVMKAVRHGAPIPTVARVLLRSLV
jgi:glycosyltransferase involved in cell wall biosynthesis